MVKLMIMSLYDGNSGEGFLSDLKETVAERNYCKQRFDIFEM